MTKKIKKKIYKRSRKKSVASIRSTALVSKRNLIIFALLISLGGIYYLGKSKAGIDLNINPSSASTCPEGLYPGVLNILTDVTKVTATTPEEAVAEYAAGGLIPNLPLRSWVKEPLENDNDEEVYKIIVAGLPYMITVQNLDTNKWAVDKIFRCS